MRIAILYICTGKYEIFWDNFFRSCEKNFYNSCEKHYFLLTDSKRLFAIKNERIHPYYQAKAGWPYDTLLRYNWFCTLQDILAAFDLCYFFNANSEVIGSIDESVLPFPTEEKPLLLNIHSHMYNDFTGAQFVPERNPQSSAYIPEGSVCRAYSGGFWGGFSKDVMRMCCTLRDRIADDMRKEIIAVWHDQSHLQKYALETAHCIAPKGLISSEEYADFSQCRIMFANKDKYGGQDKLRELSAKERFRKFPVKVYKKMLAVANKIHLKKALQKIVKCFKRSK